MKHNLYNLFTSFKSQTNVWLLMKCDIRAHSNSCDWVNLSLVSIKITPALHRVPNLTLPSLQHKTHQSKNRCIILNTALTHYSWQPLCATALSTVNTKQVQETIIQDSELKQLRSSDSPVNTVDRLQDEQPRNYNSFPRKGNRFLFTKVSTLALGPMNILLNA